MHSEKLRREVSEEERGQTHFLKTKGTEILEGEKKVKYKWPK